MQRYYSKTCVNDGNGLTILFVEQQGTFNPDKNVILNEKGLNETTFKTVKNYWSS